MAIDPKDKVVLCHPDEARLFGHHAAMVLSQIRYWRYTAFKGQSVFVVERFGQKWVARSRSQLCEETGFSPKQMRRALEKLKTYGCIVIEQHLFRGKNVSHFLVEKKAQFDLGPNGTTKKDHEGALGKAQPVHDGLAPKGQLLTTFETTSQIEKECSALHAPSNSGQLFRKEKKKQKKKKGQAGDKSPENKGMADAPGCGSNETTTSVAGRFRAAWEAVYPTDILLEFSLKELDQFKDIIKHGPSGMAGDVLEHCARHWPDFCSRAKKCEAAYNLPELPTVSAMHRWVQSAINSYLDQAPVGRREDAMAEYRLRLY